MYFIEYKGQPMTDNEGRIHIFKDVVGAIDHIQRKEARTEFASLNPDVTLVFCGEDIDNNTPASYKIMRTA